MSVGSTDRVCFERENKPPKEASHRALRQLKTIANKNCRTISRGNSDQIWERNGSQQRPQSVLTAATMVAKFILEIRGLLFSRHNTIPGHILSQRRICFVAKPFRPPYYFVTSRRLNDPPGMELRYLWMLCFVFVVLLTGVC